MTELEPQLREWLSARAPSDLPSDLMDQVQAIRGTGGGSASVRGVPLLGVLRLVLVPRAFVAWLGAAMAILLTATLVGILMVGASPPPISYQGVFTPGPTMDQPRAGHTATLLDDGRVLLAGGDDGRGTAVASTSFYDPARNRIDPGPEMVTARTGHSAVLLVDGRVLIVGGTDEPSAEIFDPAGGTFVATGDPSGAWEDARPVSLPDGRVLFVGLGGPEAALYDPVSASFSTIAIPDLGYGPAAALLADGRHVLLIAGGMPVADGLSPQLDSPAWLLDLASETVTPTGAIRTVRVHPIPLGVPGLRPRWDMTAVLLAEGQVLLVGGFAKVDGPYPTDAADLYDPKSGEFSPTGRLQVPRVGPSVTRLSDGRVLVSGGYTWDGVSHNLKIPIETVTDSAEIYDPTSGGVGLTDDMTEPRSGSSATLLADGRVFIAGGRDQPLGDPGAPSLTTEFFE